MKRLISILVILSFSYAGTIQCIGNFPLFHKLLKWNQKVSNKYVNEIIFFVFMTILPVYTIAFLVDIIVLNSIEFWTGKDALALNLYNEKGEYSKTETIADETMITTYKNFGKEMEIQIHKNDKLLKTLVLKQDKKGVFYAKNGENLDQIHVDIMKKQDSKLVVVREGAVILHTKEYSNSDFEQMQSRQYHYAQKLGMEGGQL